MNRGGHEDEIYNRSDEPDHGGCPKPPDIPSGDDYRGEPDQVAQERKVKQLEKNRRDQ